MYEVFSMTRAGRPLRAVIATAILFIVTTVLAAAVSHHKSRQAEITLGEVTPYRALGLSARLPEGWDVTSAERFATGRVLMVSPEGEDAGRRLFLFRIRTPGVGSERQARAAAVAKTIRAIDPQAKVQPAPQTEVAQLGPFQSEMFRLAMVSPSMGEDVQVQEVRANVAITPDHYVLGIMMTVDGEMSPRDLRLLKEISASISYPAAEGSDQTTPSSDELDGPTTDLEDEAAHKPPSEVDATRDPTALPAAC